jgi:hypothetical protein
MERSCSTKQLKPTETKGILKSSKELTPMVNINVNNFFKDLYEMRKPSYFNDKLFGNTANTPLSYFLKNHCGTNINNLVYHNKVKTGSTNKHYIVITKDTLILTKDFEDPCAIHFCELKNPILVKVDLISIEQTIVCFEKGRNLLQLPINSESNIKGNLM